MSSAIEQTRKRLARCTDASRKAKLGQFLTPASTADFMAHLFGDCDLPQCRLLDPGAGIGSLTSAFADRCRSDALHFESIHVTAYEVDERLQDELEKTLKSCSESLPLDYEVIPRDFIEDAACKIPLFIGDGYTHAILNPPYKKISSSSRHRLLLRHAGVETVNLYTAFMALTLELMAPGGEMVAIVPRSFCNGPYYRPFREFMLHRAAIRHIHLFDSRSRAFRDDGVLQENIIIKLERDGVQDLVTVTTSTDDNFADVATHRHPFDHIVMLGDPESFIHIPATAEGTYGPSMASHSLSEIGVEVSTGPIVDFRLKEHLSNEPQEGTVPLLYPGHFTGQKLEWPKIGLKKPNAILRNPETEKWLYPNGYYCVTRRFSSKEEKRRIVSSVVEPGQFGDAEMLGFENHLNVFHQGRSGLPEKLARGLAAYLQSSAVDEYFRTFSGHTQVNATDLRLMRYPSRETLVALGAWVLTRDDPTHAVIDAKLSSLSA